MQNIKSNTASHKLAQQSTPMKNVDLDISLDTPVMKRLPTDSVLEDPLEIQSMGSAASTKHTMESKDPHVWDRTQFLGGSDLGAILGLSSFRTSLTTTFALLRDLATSGTKSGMAANSRGLAGSSGKSE